MTAPGEGGGAAARYTGGVRPGTTIAIVALLVMIFAAAFAQFVLRLSP